MNDAKYYHLTISNCEAALIPFLSPLLCIEISLVHKHQASIPCLYLIYKTCLCLQGKDPGIQWFENCKEL